jgi:hypothetical protein
MNNNPIFIPWSGGWDSTALIIDSIKRGREVHAHHECLYRDHFFHNRVPFEVGAVLYLVPLIRNNVGPFEFTLSSTTIMGVGYQVVLLASVMCQRVEDYLLGKYSSLTSRETWCEIALPFQSTEESCWKDLQADRFMDIVDGWFKALPIKTPYISVPMVNWTKERVIDTIPPMMRRYIFTCQFPYPDGSPCGTCLSCVHEKNGMANLEV